MKANETARILSKGKSIEYSKWGPYVQYSNDCFKQDFVSYGNSLLACVQSHFSDEHTEPVLLYENSENPFNVTGVQNTDYWELVMTSDNGSVYIPEYDDETGILSWKLSSSTDSVKPVRIKLLGPWEHGTGEDSATLGLRNSADGNFSVSGGFESEANGNFSQSFGYKTKTTNDYEVAFGKLNKTSDNTAFSIGNGDSNDNRSNIFEITKDGKQYIVGIGGYDGTNFDTADDIATAMESMASNNIPITYDELKALRDANELKAGNSYQITDYVTTCVTDNAFSAEHPFDLIVTVLNSNTLSERAKAVIHEGDEYFASSNLAAWDIWYCLDNNRNKYSWAVTDDQLYTVKVSAFGTTTPVTCDYRIYEHEYYQWTFTGNSGIKVYSKVRNPDENTTIYSWDSYEQEFVEFPSAYFVIERNDASSGKGVIYRMIDEFGNDFPYDFKNIVHKMSKEYVKVNIEYDWDDETSYSGTLIYDETKNVIVYDSENEKDITYYGWRIDSHPAKGICYTLIPYDCVDKNTVLYKYVPPKIDESINIINSIGDEKNNGEYIPIDNVVITKVHINCMQYTFGNQAAFIEDLLDDSLSGDSYQNVYVNPSINPYQIPSIWIFCGQNNIFNNTDVVDKSQISWENITSDKMFIKKHTEVIESSIMSYDEVYSYCNELLNSGLYGYGSGGSGFMDSAIPSCIFRDPTYGLGSEYCPNGVSVYYKNKFYTTDEWDGIEWWSFKPTDSEYDCAVSDGVHSFVIKKAIIDYMWGCGELSFITTRFDYMEDALKDWAGKDNTQAIKNAGLFHSFTEKMNVADGEYLPSFGELNLIYLNWEKLKTKGYYLNDAVCWSSSISSNGVWVIDFSTGECRVTTNCGPSCSIFVIKSIE